MSEEDKNRENISNHPYYGTFQGVANYYPHHNPSNDLYGGIHTYYQGQEHHVLPVRVVVEARPVREHHLPCCGLGLGWILFIMGFFTGGVPWYIGAFILVCVRMDYREKPGLIACVVASLIAMIAFILGVTHPHFGKHIFHYTL
ncbi:unnamed protein product [Lathyrus sativus]|nr:unnamed protein product [Lathyrus sativus]